MPYQKLILRSWTWPSLIRISIDNMSWGSHKYCLFLQLVTILKAGDHMQINLSPEIHQIKEPASRRPPVEFLEGLLLLKYIFVILGPIKRLFWLICIVIGFLVAASLEKECCQVLFPINRDRFLRWVVCNYLEMLRAGVNRVSQPIIIVRSIFCHGIGILTRAIHCRVFLGKLFPGILSL